MQTKQNLFFCLKYAPRLSPEQCQLDECKVYRSSCQLMPRFSIYSTLNGYSENVVVLNLTVTQPAPIYVL